MDHQFEAISRVPVAVLPDPEDDEKVIVMNTGEKEERYGCIICNMGLDEALESPCPGKPLESLLEE